MGLGFLLSDLGRLLFHDQVYVIVQAIFFLPISIVIFFVEWSRGTREAPLLKVSREAKAEHAKRVEKVAQSVKSQAGEGDQLFTSRPDRERISSRILGWDGSPLNIALVKSYQPEWTMRYYCNVNVIQDYLIPLTELKPMLDLGDDSLGVYPIWLCPYLNKHHEVRSIHHPHSDKDEMYIDVGYYGLPSVVNFDMKSALRQIEDWLLPRKGFVMLYALHTLGEKDLRRMFSFEAYDRVRSRMGSASIFPTVDEKVRVG